MKESDAREQEHQGPSFPCPCCGYLVFDSAPGSYDICPICYWEDDIWQLRFPHEAGGANTVSLVEGQANFVAYGACEDHVREYTRKPRPNEQRDRHWHPVDDARAKVECRGDTQDIQGSYPRDRTLLYYWSPRFWRRDIRTENDPGPESAPN
jgi:hypothetical protein